MPRWSASLRSPVFHFPPLTNCTTPTVQPRAQPRAITPNADDDLPFPWPVFRTTLDDARAIPPTLRPRRLLDRPDPSRGRRDDRGDGSEGGAGARGLRCHQRRRQVVGGDRPVPPARPPGLAGGAV